MNKSSVSNGKNSKVSTIQQPGPGSYNLPSALRVEHSLSKQGNTTRFRAYDTITPGPGNYSDGKKDHQPTALMVSRQKQHKPDDIPGPGSYQADYKKVIKSQSGYHIGKSQSSSMEMVMKNAAKAPGPGSYNTNQSTLTNSKSAVGFGPERKIQLADTKNVPGPGNYDTLNYKQTISRQPSMVFSKSGRSNSTTLLAPGPGSYQAPSMFEAINKKKGFSMSQKPPIVDRKAYVPGPGSYKMEEIDKLKFKSSSFSLPKSPRLKIDNEKEILSRPGPERYLINKSAMEHQSFTMSKVNRKGLADPSFAPGPGSYSISALSNQPKFSVPKSKVSWIRPDSNPGPGVYDIKEPPHSNVVGMNKDNRKPLNDDKKTPGPGNYQFQQLLNTKGGFKIGNQKRQDLGSSRAKNPGPGEYELPSTLKGSRTIAH